MQKAKIARKSCHTIGAQSLKNFKFITRSDQTQNCPVTLDNVNLADKTYGKDISHSEWKTTGRQSHDNNKL